MFKLSDLTSKHQQFNCQQYQSTSQPFLSQSATTLANLGASTLDLSSPDDLLALSPPKSLSPLGSPFNMHFKIQSQQIFEPAKTNPTSTEHKAEARGQI